MKALILFYICRLYVNFFSDMSTFRVRMIFIIFVFIIFVKNMYNFRNMDLSKCLLSGVIKYDSGSFILSLFHSPICKNSVCIHYFFIKKNNYSKLCNYMCNFFEEFDFVSLSVNAYILF